jgi:desulfoferrodoxin (superoxide reductase-like protein)
VATLPIEYRIVKRCGQWQAGDRMGYYRVIVGDVYHGAGSELYVQWIEEATQEKPAVLVKTLGFAELNDDHGQYDFESVDCEQRSGRTTIRARATYEHDEPDQVRDISIQLLDIGKYRLTQRERKAAKRAR